MLTPPPANFAPPRSRAALAPDPLRPRPIQKESDGKRLRQGYDRQEPVQRRHHRSSCDGSVLIAVLAIILLLSFLITKFMEEALEDLEYRSIFNEPADVRSYAYSMLELSLATIQEVALIDEGKLYAPEQGWGRPLDYANVQVPNGWELSIEITDEGGKLPINTMDEELLNKMLEETFEFDFGTARELSSMLLDWIDADSSKRLNGAESEDYLRRNPPYRAANGPLQSLEELRMLEVWEDEFFDEEGQPNQLSPNCRIWSRFTIQER